MARNVTLKDPRIVRIFISSPFRGMEVERERLTSLYWPRLREVLLSRGLLLRVVDMRWGITTDMSSDHQTISICLREIDRSDIFIGLYGQRYGWHGEHDAELQRNFDKAQRRYPWVDGYRDRSVTELEFLHGHLNDPGTMAACFAFRDPAYDSEQCAKAKTRGDQKGELSHSPEDQESQELIFNLKQRIADTSTESIGINLDYDNPEQCVEFVYNCVHKYINDNILVNRTGAMSNYEKSQLAHDLYLKSRTGKYISGDPYFMALDKYVDRKGGVQPFVISGPTGSEKCSLLGSWLKLREAREENRDVVIYHFVNAEPRASNASQLLMRLVGNVEEKVMGRQVDTESLDTDAETLLARLDDLFAELREEKHKNKKVIIIVDMVEQILPEKSTNSIYMIPKALPDNVRVILTVILGSEASKQSLEILVEEYNCEILEIKPLGLKDKYNLCKLLLDQHSKSLSSEQLDMIIKSEKTSNPFFLHNLILELCISGQFRKLDEQIETFLNCEDVVELLCHIMKRIEEEYSHPDYDGNLVKDILCAICLSRRGISESEFPMPDYMWLPVVYALKHLTINRSGLLSFVYPELAQVVERLYMPDVESRQQAARKVCQIFQEEFQESTVQNFHLLKRAALELPHLVHESGDLVRLKKIISTFTVFEVLSKAAPLELLQYWQVLGCSGQVIARAYLHDLDRYIADRYATYMRNGNAAAIPGLILWKAARLKDIRVWMAEVKLLDGVELVFDREIEILARISKRVTLESTINMCNTRFDKGNFLVSNGRYSEAYELHKDVLIVLKSLIERHAIGEEGLHASYNALGRCCCKLNKLEEAEQHYTSARNAIISNPIQKQNLAWAYHNLGLTCHRMGKQIQALEYLHKAVSLWHELVPHRPSPGDALSSLNIGKVYQTQGDLKSAERWYRKALNLNESLFGRDSVAVGKVLTSLSLLAERKRDHRKSLTLVTKSLEIFHQKLPKDHRHMALSKEIMARQIKELNLGPDHGTLEKLQKP